MGHSGPHPQSSPYGWGAPGIGHPQCMPGTRVGPPRVWAPPFPHIGSPWAPLWDPQTSQRTPRLSQTPPILVHPRHLQTLTDTPRIKPLLRDPQVPLLSTPRSPRAPPIQGHPYGPLSLTGTPGPPRPPLRAGSPRAPLPPSGSHLRRAVPRWGDQWAPPLLHRQPPELRRCGAAPQLSLIGQAELRHRNAWGGGGGGAAGGAQRAGWDCWGRPGGLWGRALTGAEALTAREDLPEQQRQRVHIGLQQRAAPPAQVQTLIQDLGGQIALRARLHRTEGLRWGYGGVTVGLRWGRAYSSTVLTAVLCLQQHRAHSGAMLAPKPSLHQGCTHTTAMLAPGLHLQQGLSCTKALLAPKPHLHQSHACLHQSHTCTRATLAPEPHLHQSHTCTKATLAPKPCLLAPKPHLHQSHTCTKAMLACTKAMLACTKATPAPKPYLHQSHAHTKAMLTPGLCSHHGHACTKATLTPGSLSHTAARHASGPSSPHPSPPPPPRPPCGHPADVRRSLPAAAVSAGRQRHGEPEVPDGARAVVAHQHVLTAEVAVHHAGFVQP